LFKFARNMYELNLNDTQLSLFCAVALISADRPGIQYETSIENLQRELLKALNLNIILEHQQKNLTLSPKIRFLEVLKLLPELRELNYEHSQKLNLMQLHCVNRHDSPAPASPSSEYNQNSTDDNDWRTINYVQAHRGQIVTSVNSSPSSRSMLQSESSISDGALSSRDGSPDHRSPIGQSNQIRDRYTYGD
jgi:hypothetical protein